MTALSQVEKDDLLRALAELPPEALAEVRDFIEFQKFKAQAGTSAQPVAIGGWLKNQRFSGGDIDEARKEMWTRFEDKAA